MPRRFVTLDVFTGEALAGNPLAVVLDAEGLDTAAMQAIAKEFNLSETVFVGPPENERHRAALRIFTPKNELPFAGHPTVGTAVLLGLLDGGEPTGNVLFGLEEDEGSPETALYRHLILTQGSSGLSALLVDRALDVASLDGRQLSPLSQASTLNGCVEAEITLGGRLVHLLSLERLLLAEERQTLGELSRQAQDRLGEWAVQA